MKQKNQLFPIKIQYPEDLNIAVFQTLSLCRWHSISSIDSFRKIASRACIRFPYRSAFWLQLAQQTGLVTFNDKFIPTNSAQDWWDLPLSERWSQSLAAWTNLSKTSEGKRQRKRILEALSISPDSPHLSISDMKVARSLNALGLWNSNNEKNLRNKVFNIQGYTQTPSDCSTEKKENVIRLIPPFDFAFLWLWEKYVKPVYPFTYSINETYRCNFPERTRLFFEKALNIQFPKKMDCNMAIVYDKSVLFFQSKEMVNELRKQPHIRNKLQHPISSLAFLIDKTEKQQIVRMLSRRNISIIDRSEQDVLRQINLELFSPDEIEYLWNLLENAISTDTNSSLENLQRKLYMYLPAYTSQQDKLPISQIPMEVSVVDQKFDETNLADLEHQISTAIEQEATLIFIYQVPARERPERRTVSPLILEKRGDKQYLIAYDHNRRANRTFRLDRIQRLLK